MLIAHRGSYVIYPEHSIGSYTDAYYAGADFIELDLEVTKDGQLIVQHDAYLDDSTNIDEHEDRFEERCRDEDGLYYVSDFTLAELKTIKRRQRYLTRS